MVHPILQMLVPIADGLAKTLGENCEVAIHDLTHPGHSIYHVVNGDLLGRKNGDSLGPAFKELVYLATRNQDSLINYRHYENGHILKCTKVLIRDESKKPIGCFCINIAIDDYLKCRQIIDGLCYTRSIEEMVPDESVQSEPENMIFDLAKDMISNTYKDFTLDKPTLSKHDKIKFVQFLNQKGIFQVKGAVDMVASLLHVSKYTVYRYVSENSSVDEE